MPRTHILALDQGTTSSRAVVFDQEGRAVASSQREFPQHYPRPGWVEHDPLAIWASQWSTAIETLGKADLLPADIAAIGITNQRETTLLWERETGKPVYPAIVWQDRRTADFCASLKAEGVEDLFTRKTGLRLDPYFSATKIRWILDHVDGSRKLAEQGKLMFGTVDTWLLWRLSGRTVHATDATNASRTLLYDIHRGDWDDELLEILEIPRSILPEVKDSSGIFGESSEGIPISGIAGDQHAALFGQGCFSSGMAKNTYGTGCFMLMNTGSEAVASQNNLLTTIAWRIGGKTEYALEGSVFVGGAVVQWLRDELQLIRTAEECNALAATVPDSGGLYLVPAFTGLGAPHWDPYARGAAFGMTRGTNRAHFCRAALESIAFQSAELAECMVKDSGIPLKELRVDGGAVRSDLLMQFQADLLGVNVIRPKDVESTAAGAAYLAGLGVGFWEGKEELARHHEIDREFHPSRPRQEMEQLEAGWRRAVERAKAWES
ncbi:glycerol kinase GlpK [Luteolibacter luteus]|uniref:Glycerol kinase n=1 Tax=Luteolibacter luteus TaxID=2728835 RepID=A0A858RHB9_9BACT|nr:glycerol kinase GlpK [Luteolibacter luteus]QJE95944.1 glycerol kinase GlpK [Luteolibacter luteus]